MYISKFQLFHYKSFLESGTLEFKPGINLITGQNNSGKSALLQALTLDLSNIPHRSPKTLTTPKSNQILKISSAKVSLLLEKDELKPILEDFIHKDYPDKNSIDSAADETLIKELGASGFREWLAIREEVELSLSFNAATPPQIETEPSKISRHAVEFVFNEFKKRIFRFRAERLKLESSPYGDSDQLTSDASNLAQCLSKLQGNKKKFERFNNYVSLIFPQIKLISVTNKGSNFEIMVWPIDTDIDELAFPLSACGTGIGQVLAILYVVLTSQDWRTIIIDEPQSFLHPGAEKKLVDILKEFPQHQYFIATHSPTIIANANPSTIVMLRSQDCETVASVMKAEDSKELGNLMDELGVKLSDVFGADNILWVECPTEEACFRKILEAKRPLRGTTILAVNSTGDFEQKDYRSAEIIFKIYEKVSGKESLFPPAIGFIFDKEDRDSIKIEDMKRRSGERLKFLPRRMYENYLLHPEAIADVINQEDKEEQQQPLTGANIQDWINQNKHNESYFPKNFPREKLSDSSWVDENIHGANILADLFTQLSDTRVVFRKPLYPTKITEWLLQHEPNHFSELTEFLQECLDDK
jgi:AAA15 family ATPase/GTPase